MSRKLLRSSSNICVENECTCFPSRSKVKAKPPTRTLCQLMHVSGKERGLIEPERLPLLPNVSANKIFSELFAVVGTQQRRPVD